MVSGMVWWWCHSQVRSKVALSCRSCNDDDDDEEEEEEVAEEEEGHEYSLLHIAIPVVVVVSYIQW